MYKEVKQKELYNINFRNLRNDADRRLMTVSGLEL